MATQRKQVSQTWSQVGTHAALHDRYNLAEVVVCARIAGDAFSRHSCLADGARREITALPGTESLVSLPVNPGPLLSFRTQTATAAPSRKSGECGAKGKLINFANNNKY